MQENLDREFDLLIRSKMADVEEKVPSRVWNAIDSRLGKPKAAWGWKETGICLAVAASVLLAVILSGTFSSRTITTDTEITSSALAQTVDTTEPEVQVTVEASQTEMSAAPAPVMAGKTPKPEAVTPAATVSTDKPYEESEAAEEAIKEEKPDSTIEKTTSPAKEVRTFTDPFATADYEDSQKSGRKVLFEANGILGNNGDIKNTLSGGKMAVSGNKGPVTGVSENGESVYGIPVTFGIGARVYLTEKLSLGSGLNYSLLTRPFQGIYTEVNGGNITLKTGNCDITHTLQYVGIPLNIYYDVLDTGLLKFYVFGGGTAEKCISDRYRIHTDPETLRYSESATGVQLSTALGLGLQFPLTDRLGLYIDPSARYYFDCNQPKSVRTQRPFMFNFEVGLRFGL